MNEALLMLCAILGLFGFLVSLICVAMIAGFLRSTHTVQYIPQEVPLDPLKKWEEEDAELEKLKESVGRKKRPDPIAEEMEAVLDEVSKSDVLF